MKIPSWTLFYDEREQHVNQMVFPLSSKIFAPSFYTPGELRNNGVTHLGRVIWFNGFHACYLKGESFKSSNPFRRMSISPPVILVRPEPEFATFFAGRKEVLEPAVYQICKKHDDLNVVVVPRSQSQAHRYSKFPVKVLSSAFTANPVAYSEVVIGAAETMLMEAFVLGIPAVSCVYWPESRPVEELHKYIPRVTDPDQIVQKVLDYVDGAKRTEFQARARLAVEGMENPIDKMVKAIEDNLLQAEKTASRAVATRRSKIEICFDIMRTLSLRPAKLTQIMQAANLSYKETKEDLRILMSKSLVEKKSDMSGSYFFLTQEGGEMLRNYRTIRDKLSI